ncbi:carboxypeptidase-like regulatory domain-containing protein [Hymenobacter sp. NST-14]|uniref:carboxypeptidase-like regulatory domain-containing protein n=1 Tax=Hymenobacter piscis TaxID=2839984 RepID=UPI001C00B932|nr:carboxypeptidase-like regulatory domain-containing protein [Hymenobacter piscis]MBT9392489.1 carboxypeptidase-like regulatory domain-containing protein [Hymenobacter piscis]
MRLFVLLPLFLIISSLKVFGQNRVIQGRVVSEHLETLPMVSIANHRNESIGKTDMDGRFKIAVSQGVDSLLFSFIGMEWAEIKLKQDCDVVEVVMMYDMTYCFYSLRKVDRLRKRRFEKLSAVHADALKKGLFEQTTICYDREFESFKP